MSRKREDLELRRVNNGFGEYHISYTQRTRMGNHDYYIKGLLKVV